jgi:hypothetical protein
MVEKGFYKQEEEKVEKTYQPLVHNFCLLVYNTDYDLLFKDNKPERETWFFCLFCG